MNHLNQTLPIPIHVRQPTHQPPPPPQPQTTPPSQTQTTKPPPQPTPTPQPSYSTPPTYQSSPTTISPPINPKGPAPAVHATPLRQVPLYSTSPSPDDAKKGEKSDKPKPPPRRKRYASKADKPHPKKDKLSNVEGETKKKVPAASSDTSTDDNLPLSLILKKQSSVSPAAAKKDVFTSHEAPPVQLAPVQEQSPSPSTVASMRKGKRKLLIDEEEEEEEVDDDKEEERKELKRKSKEF